MKTLLQKVISNKPIYKWYKFKLMQTTMKGRSEKLDELPFWNKLFVT